MIRRTRCGPRPAPCSSRPSSSTASSSSRRAGGARWEPPVDVFETERELCIIAALPGVAPEAVRVEFEGQTLDHRRRPPPAEARAQRQYIEAGDSLWPLRAPHCPHHAPAARRARAAQRLPDPHFRQILSDTSPRRDHERHRTDHAALSRSAAEAAGARAVRCASARRCRERGRRSCSSPKAR